MKQLYTWQEFDEDIEKIAAWARSGNFQNVYGIPRGGLVAAVALSHRLEISMLFNLEEIGMNTLVVDDIADTGKTIEYLENKIVARPKFATLVVACDARRLPDFAVRKKENWVVFPWEVDSDAQYDGTLERLV